MKRKLLLQKIKADIINGFDGKNGIDNRRTTGGKWNYKKALETRGQFHQRVYVQLLHTQSPNVQKDA